MLGTFGPRNRTVIHTLEQNLLHRECWAQAAHCCARFGEVLARGPGTVNEIDNGWVWTDLSCLGGDGRWD